ncbi:MAG: hypothetical protein QG671_3029, partial [Actinomycetota bacterium]|nr:hypothetical protein [Actinomycetota bacterium]
RRTVVASTCATATPTTPIPCVYLTAPPCGPSGDPPHPLPPNPHPTTRDLRALTTAGPAVLTPPVRRRTCPNQRQVRDLFIVGDVLSMEVGDLIIRNAVGLDQLDAFAARYWVAARSASSNVHSADHLAVTEWVVP